MKPLGPGHRLAPLLLSLTLFFTTISSSVLGQSLLVAEGMITPKDATTTSEIVVVQMRTAVETPGPPFVVSLDPPRLALSTQAGPTGMSSGEPFPQNIGKLAAGAWQVYSYGIDWSEPGIRPAFEGFSGPDSFQVTRGEVYPKKSLHPIAGERFSLRVGGPWGTSCAPEIEGVSIEGQSPTTVVIHLRRTEVLCQTSEEGPMRFTADASIGPLGAGRYEVEVRVPELEGERIEVFATASLRIVDADAPRILDLMLEQDLEREAHRLIATIEIPTATTGGGGCVSWNVRAGSAFAHGRDLYAPFEVEPVSAECGDVVTATFRLPLPDLDSGLYRILAHQEQANGVSELWAQSKTLVELRELRRLIGGRFQVTATWRDHRGRTGRAVPVRATDVPQSEENQSAIFYFFSEDNWEMLVKVLDGCSLNSHYWVFASASTDVDYTLRVEDVLSGAEVTYRNELGQASPAITDTTALAICE